MAMPDPADQPVDGKRCFHCGLPVPETSRYAVDIAGQTRRMCCPGCKAVAEAIVNAGLSDFYRYRTEVSPTAQPLVPGPTTSTTAR